MRPASTKVLSTIVWMMVLVLLFKAFYALISIPLWLRRYWPGALPDRITVLDALYLSAVSTFSFLFCLCVLPWLVMKGKDAAHRFAQRSHHMLRSKGTSARGRT